MKNFGLLAALVAASLFVGAFGTNAPPASAAVHCMRVYGVMGGLNGDTSIQYVELRMSSGGQTFTNGSQLTFYNASGGSPVTFTLTSNMTNGASGASILIGTASFDAAWAAGTPDFIMPANVISPSGKVAFGVGQFNCLGSGMPYDSVAYSDATGTPYSGMVDYAPAFSVAGGLATNASQAVQLKAGAMDITQGPGGNNADYEIVSSPMPRNNAGQQGGVVVDNDLDDDGVLNVNDLCPNTAPMATVDSVGCSDAQVDQDGDGDCSPGAPSDGPSNCTLMPSDNCPLTANPTQSNVDGDAPGDACDTEGPAGNMNGVGGGDDCADMVDNDGDGPVDFADSGCNSTDSDGDTIADVSDNCPMVANPGQQNFDGDSQGDACDSDDDDDGYSDEAEAGTPVCVGNVNDDQAPIDATDTSGFVNDGCPAVGLAEVSCSGTGDEDGDGRVNDGCPQVGAYSEGAYNLGTGTVNPCHVGATAPSPSWPSDFTSGGIPLSTDKITVTDLTSFVAPRRLDTSPGATLFTARWDLTPGRGLFSNWININDLTALIAGSSGFPAMFGGARAFNGPTCTGP